MIRERILFRLFFSLLLLLSFSPFCTYEPTFQIHPNLSTYFKYPQEVRRLIYTTNTIEGFNRQLRKVTKSKSVFPTADSLLKMLYLAMMVCTPSRGQRNKSTKNISICLQITIMLFHRCQNAKVTLETFRVVVMDITANHFHQFSTTRETLSIITLSLQDAPKSFHRAIVNAAANTRHTLYHASIDQPLVEVSVGILKSTVTVEDRMRIRISLDCLCKSVEHKFVVVCIPNRKGNNTSVI